ncbi:MAG: helix-turn-helix domain-containing protein [Sphingomonas sp.]
MEALPDDYRAVMRDRRVIVPTRSYYGVFPAPIGRARVRPAPGTFHSELAGVELDRLSVAVGRFSAGTKQVSDMDAAHTFVFPTEPGLVRRVSGRILGHRQIFHFRPNEQTVASSPAGMPWAFGVLIAPFDLLAAHLSTAAGADGIVPLNDDRMFEAPKAPMARLLALMDDVARLVRETPWVLEALEPARALEGSILDALAACLSQGLVRPDRAAIGRHRQIVARFEQALRDRPEEMLSLAAICAAVGVAERTLNLACQGFLGESAVHYARGRRLDLVRERLRVSDPTDTYVTDVAMDYGFWELGRFAQAYRRRFGERPSETLRRPV